MNNKDQKIIADPDKQAVKFGKTSRWEEVIYGILDGIVGAFIVFFLINVGVAVGFIDFEQGQSSTKTAILSFCIFLGAAITGFYTWPKTAWISGGFTAAFSLLPLGWLAGGTRPNVWQKLLPFSEVMGIFPFLLTAGFMGGLAAGFLGWRACQMKFPVSEEVQEEQTVSYEELRKKFENDIRFRIIAAFLGAGALGICGAIIGFIAFFFMLIVVLGILGLKPSGELALAVVSGIGGMAAGFGAIFMTKEMKEIRIVSIFLSGAAVGFLFPLPIALVSGMTYYRSQGKPSDLLPFAQVPEFWPYCILGGIIGAIVIFVLYLAFMESKMEKQAEKTDGLKKV